MCISKQNSKLLFPYYSYSDGTIGDSTDSEAHPDRLRCKLCGQSYTTLGNLRGHVKLVHGGRLFEFHIPYSFSKLFATNVLENFRKIGILRVDSSELKSFERKEVQEGEKRQ